MSFLVRYITADGRYKILNPATDSVDIAGVILGAGTNVVTMSGPNSLASVSGAIDAKIDSVSGASSLRDDAQDLLLQSVSGSLQALVLSVSGGSSIRDDAQDAALSVSAASLTALAMSVSGASSLRDDAQDAALMAVSGASSLRDDAQDAALASVSGASSLRDDQQDATTAAVSGSLQAQINAITSDFAKEEIFEFVDGQTVIGPLVTIAYDPSYSRRDIQVFRNGQKVQQSVSASEGDWEKYDGDKVRFHVPLAGEGKVVVRDERTGGGGGGVSGSTDLEQIVVNPQPSVNGAQSLGSTVRAWSAVYLRDTVTSDIYRVEMVSGALQAALVV